MLLNFKKATIFNNDKFSSETNETSECEHLPKAT